jgi:hypothetical protein
MGYPRQCEGCKIRFEGVSGQGDAGHVTLDARDGGARSPWAADLPGRILEIGCKACGAIFEWDYFRPASDGRLGVSLALLREPVAAWKPGDSFALGPSRRSAYEPQRRAS